ncbi:MAG: hypothetical protein F6J97_17220 [Leptolyngbya sp. SIO4C1]|nr:hypothetical protein [Leptolyngbya sp. SIO4C1]
MGNLHSHSNSSDSTANSLPPDLGLPTAADQGQAADSSDWQVVDFPDTISVDNIPGVAPSASREPMNPTDSASSSPRPNASRSPQEREAELLSLVRDLNDCNDVLLGKVAQLEDALDRSQSALQSEIERSGSAASSEPRISDRHIAQLVTELEAANQGLKRYQLLSETLQTELASAQERVTQLDRDCTLLQHQCSEQSQMLTQADYTCRDLRSRLHRQQRYTMQFKAALEKCLNVSANAPTESIDFVSTAAVDAATAPVVSMPKAQTIQPWASEGGYQQMDTQLAALLRESQAAAQPTASNSAADDQLWQDLARMIETPTEQTLETDTALETEPSFTVEPPEPAAEAEESLFTEPSPWHTDAPAAPAAEAQPQAEAYVPAMDFAAEESPSPVVRPLRAQKRIRSLAAVELPSFANPLPKVKAAK